MHRLAADRLVLLRPSMTARLTTAPGRFTHAFLDGVATTLCGLDVGSLYSEELRAHLWDDLSPMLRCRACAEAMPAG